MTNLPTTTDEPIQIINYRINEFCRAHGIGRTTCYQEIKNKNLKIFKIGSTTLISADAARAWQESKMSA